MSFIADLQAANASIEKFKGAITKHIKGELVSIELEDETIARMFDQYSGIDALHVINGQVRGVALRCQWRNPRWSGVYPFNTFTIRHKRSSGAKTEYEKRMEAIYGGYGFFYPYLTIQAYFDDKSNPSEILSFAIVKTEDMYGFVSTNIDNPSVISRRTVGEDGNEFLAVKFAALEEAGCKIITWDKRGETAFAVHRALPPLTIDGDRITVNTTGVNPFDGDDQPWFENDVVHGN